MTHYIDDTEHYRACAALYRAHLRAGYTDVQFNQPNKYLTTRRGNVITLSNCNGKLGHVRVYRDGRMRAVEEVLDGRL